MGLQNFLMNKLIENSTFGRRIQSTNNVTEKGQYALDATEKNPEIEDSLAEKIVNLENETTRIENSVKKIIALPNGATTGDAQIEDAKTGIEGESYDTLGDAIREQIKTYRDVNVSNTMPTDKSKVWVNTSENDTESQDIIIPQIDDEEISEENTWSSSKIDGELSSLSALIVEPTDISCWGDELTYGYGAIHGATDYPSVLSKLVDKTVHNLGITGEDVPQIMARQGGYLAKVNPFTIPAHKTPVEITYVDTINAGADATKLGEQGGLNLVNPVTISGVDGDITYSSSKFFFVRSEEGDSVDVKRPTPVIPHNVDDRCSDTQIIYIGSNGGWCVDGDDARTRIDKLTSEIDLMIDHCTSGQYIVIGMHYYYSWMLSDDLTVDMIETAMQRKYGDHYINLRKYMVEYGLSDANIIPEHEDNEAIKNGEVPPSLLHSDKIHGNDIFYNILANLVKDQGEILGYW